MSKFFILFALVFHQLNLHSMKSHNIFLRISALKCHYLLLVVALLTSPMGYSQTGGCGTASPDAAGLEAAEAIALAAATAASTAAASITPPPSC